MVVIGTRRDYILVTEEKFVMLPRHSTVQRRQCTVRMPRWKRDLTRTCSRFYQSRMITSGGYYFQNWRQNLMYHYRSWTQQTKPLFSLMVISIESAWKRLYVFNDLMYTFLLRILIYFNTLVYAI